MVRAPVALDARLDFLTRRLLAGTINRRIAELDDGAQSGRVLARVQGLVIGRTIQIDDVARIGRDDQRRTQLARKGVQPRNVPVRIRHVPRFRRHSLRDVIRQRGAVVRQGQQQRCGTSV